MKKEFTANDFIYMIAIFVMPIVTFIGVTKLQTDIINISDIIKVGASDYNTLFLGDMILFITCWVSLFVSYILYKNNIKLAQCLIFIGSIVYLIYNINLAINSYGSISSIINPLIVLTTSLYALCKPVEMRKTENIIVVDAIEEVNIDELEEKELDKKEEKPKKDNEIAAKKTASKKSPAKKKTSNKNNNNKSDKK